MENTLPAVTKSTGFEIVRDKNGNVEIVIDWRLDNYISYVAAGGLQVLDDGSAKAISLNDFADRIGTNRQLLWRWRNALPDFAARVKRRRREIFSEDRESQIWKGLFLRAARGDAEQAKMVLSHFSDYQPPAQKIDATVAISGFADLVAAAQAQGIMEAEIVPDGSSDNIPS